MLYITCTFIQWYLGAVFPLWLTMSEMRQIVTHMQNVAWWLRFMKRTESRKKICIMSVVFCLTLASVWSVNTKRFRAWDFTACGHIKFSGVRIKCSHRSLQLVPRHGQRKRWLLWQRPRYQQTLILHLLQTHHHLMEADIKRRQASINNLILIIYPTRRLVAHVSYFILFYTIKHVLWQWNEPFFAKN